MSAGPVCKRKVTDHADLILSKIGLRILRRREALGLTQRALAEQLGMAHGNLNRIEHGQQNLTIRTICRLTEVLGVTFDELVTGASPPEG